MSLVAQTGSQSHKQKISPAQNGEPSEPAVLRLEDLAPYLSLRLLWIEEAKGDWTKELVNFSDGVDMLITSVFKAEELKSITKIAGRFLPCGSDTSSSYFDKADSGLLARLNQERSGWMAGCVLPIQTKPSWLKRTSSTKLKNTSHHLVCVAMLPPFVAVSSTLTRLVDSLVALLQDESALGIRLPLRLSVPPAELLDKTFVRGEAFNVWLDGLHRPTVFKADKQTMQGPDLRRALDPVSHRTFTYSSVRSRLQATLPSRSQGAAVGYSKTSGAVWVGTTIDTHDYMRQLAVLCDLVLKTKKEPPKKPKAAAEEEEASRFGFRHLSQEIDPNRLFEAKDPFEVDLDLGEPSEGEIDQVSDRKSAIETWRSSGQFRVSPGSMKQRETATKQKELVISVEALWDGNVFRTFDLVVHPSIDGKLHLASERFKDVPGSGVDPVALETFDTLDAELGPRAFVIRFDSGHVLNAERLYLPVPPTALFRGWEWVKFDKPDYDVTKEKPKKWNVTRSLRNFQRVQAVSANDLFSFLVKNIEKLKFLASKPEWYVLCHDQPQEVADFVALVPPERSVAHIHVKGAKSSDSNRRVAIGAYDLVVTQAIKNLPRLDAHTLLAALEMGASSDHEAGQFIIYKNDHGVQKSMDCSPFMMALRNMTSRPLLKRQIIIFQPHVRAKLWLPKINEWESATNRLAIPGIQPIFMLSSLLLDAQIACMRVDAEFSVWGTWDFADGKSDKEPKHSSPFLLDGI